MRRGAFSMCSESARAGAGLTSARRRSAIMAPANRKRSLRAAHPETTSSLAFAWGGSARLGAPSNSGCASRSCVRVSRWAPDGGALEKLLPPFRLGLGGTIGNGRQWFSWIHVGDLVAIYVMALDRLEGPLNACAPNPVTNATFTKELARSLQRPAPLAIPAFALRALLGEGAELALHGQRVLPERTQQLGFRFEFPELKDALKNLL